MVRSSMVCLLVSAVVAAPAAAQASQQANAMQEILARNYSTFVQLDTEHCGQLSQVKFAQFYAAGPRLNDALMLQDFDANEDAVMTLVEFCAGTFANFDRLHTNKDGIVSAAKMRAGGIIQK